MFFLNVTIILIAAIAVVILFSKRENYSRAMRYGTRLPNNQKELICMQRNKICERLEKAGGLLPGYCQMRNKTCMESAKMTDY